MPTNRDPEFVRLFKWAVTRKVALSKELPFVCTPDTLVHLLSVEGVRDELKIDQIEETLPLSISTPLRYFHKLDQGARLRRATRLLKECL